MIARLFLHIGPPKSATTSFQIAFQEASFDWLEYGGAFQPRERNTASLAQHLHQFAAGRREADDPEVEAAVEHIRRCLVADRSVLISEEMFLVEQRGCGFVRKLERLASLLAGIPTTVLITLRDPEDGLPSLYQELFQGLPLREKLSFGRFCAGARARCYDYWSVMESLRHRGFTEIRTIDFTELTGAGLDVSRAFAPVAPKNAALTIGRSNSGAKSADGRAVPAVTIKALGGNRTIRAVLDRTRVRDTSLYRVLVQFLDRVALRSASAQHFRIPGRLRQRYAENYRQACDHREHEHHTS